MPEEFRLVSESVRLSVHLTPVGAPARLWVESQDLTEIVVRGDADVQFHYIAYGVRRGHLDRISIREADEPAYRARTSTTR